ncbi:MAG: OmpA family protein [Spirochaetes bacterium]|nr:OmpA family protein [Spirochaetota bacterium]
MKIYIKQDEKFIEIFNTKHDTEKHFTYTTTINLQKQATFYFYLNKKIEKKVQFTHIPPARKNIVKIYCNMRTSDDNSCLIEIDCFQHHYEEVIQLDEVDKIPIVRIALLSGVGILGIVIFGLLTFFLINLVSNWTDSGRRNEKTPVKITQDNLQQPVQSEEKSEVSPVITSTAEEEGIETEESVATEAQPVEEVPSEPSALELLKTYLTENYLFFQKDLTVLLPEEQDKIDTIVSYIEELDQLVLLIEGHTADIGLDENEENLSQARAVKIRDLLTEYTSDKVTFQIRFYGSSMPLYADPQTDEEKQANRRVQISVVE